jgi:signal transduction histidine kinase/CheY-like chemotaxis protein
MELIRHRPIVGKPVAEARPEIETQGYIELMDRVYETGKAFSATAAPHTYRNEGGSTHTRYLDFVYQPIREPSGEVSGIFVIGVDVTERALAETALRDADRRKDEFLAMLAHELRNPLAPIGNAAELISRRDLNDAPTRNAADIVRRQVAQLTRIVDDLLDVSRISTGRIELRRETLLLSEVIDRAIETVAPIWRQKHHQISIRSSLEPLHVQGDPARLVQSFANVISNAAKYTQSKGLIEIEVIADDKNACVRISDNGSGIAPEFIPYVFDLFAQADRALDRSQGGLGIGLSVVKRLIQLHGGEVTARSEGEGRGAMFEISLPRVADCAIATPSEGLSSSVGRRVLIVDDNVDAATSLAALLELAGHRALTAFNSRDALDLAVSFDPQAVVLDIGIPELDGYQLARQIRQSPGSTATLIALTGYGQQDDRRLALEAGFDAYLVKPADITALGRLLQ